MQLLTRGFVSRGTKPKSDYSWSTYAYGSYYNQLTKFCYNSKYGLNGFVDNMTTLQYSEGVATVVLGNGARIPTESEYDELRHNTTSEWMTVNGVYGMRFTAANGNSIFFPAVGQISDTTHYYAGTYGFYWHFELFVVSLCNLLMLRASRSDQRTIALA